MLICEHSEEFCLVFMRSFFRTLLSWARMLMHIHAHTLLTTQLTPDEMLQIAAFPSILRLLASYALIDELAATDGDTLRKIERIDFHRVIDNKKVGACFVFYC